MRPICPGDPQIPGIPGDAQRPGFQVQRNEAELRYRLVWACSTAPAVSSLSTTGMFSPLLSFMGIEPAVTGHPAMASSSFTEVGMPSSARAALRIQRTSDSRAAASALSK
jgi:hypothetical protein